MARKSRRAADGMDDLRACTDDFTPMLTMAEAKPLAEKWSEARMSVGITLAFGAIGRADMVAALRSIAETDGGEDAVIEAIGAVTALIERTEQFVELFQTIRARLFIAAVEMTDRVEAEQA